MGPDEVHSFGCPDCLEFCFPDSIPTLIDDRITKDLREEWDMLPFNQRSFIFYSRKMRSLFGFRMKKDLSNYGPRDFVFLEDASMHISRTPLCFYCKNMKVQSIDDVNNLWYLNRNCNVYKKPSSELSGIILCDSFVDWRN